MGAAATLASPRISSPAKSTRWDDLHSGHTSSSKGLSPRRPSINEAAVCRRPYERPGDQRIDQLVAIESTQNDPVPPTAAAAAAAEGDGGDRHPARLELPPDRLVAQELARSRPKSRLVDARRLAVGRGPARLSWEGMARRARTGAPTARDVQPRERSRLAQVVDAAACVRRGPAGRAPLIEPEHAVTHPLPASGLFAAEPK
jgi:hypothetical protein